eukprot:jgi/Orpsp1_1/1189617/evm.model.d7180000073262.1
MDINVLIANREDTIYEYILNEKKLIILEYDGIFRFEKEVMIVIDNNMKSPLDSYEPTEATAFYCKYGECELNTETLSSSTSSITLPSSSSSSSSISYYLSQDKYFICELSKDKLLIKYNENNKWKIVDKSGYNFFNEKMESINNNNDYVLKGFEVSVVKNEVKHKDITNSKITGFYLNKANNNTIFIKNNEDGLPCISENDVISQAIRISNNGKKVINEKIELKYLEDDVYVNEFNLNTVILYNGKKWIIQIANCFYDSETDSCINDYIEFSINGYCICKNKLNIIINDTNDDYGKCIPGNDQIPVYKMNDNNNRLMKVKSKSLKYIREEGYYVFDKNSHKAIQFDNDEITTETSLVYCDYNGNCQEKTPDVGSYINKSSSPWNVINYNFETNNRRSKPKTTGTSDSTISDTEADTEEDDDDTEIPIIPEKTTEEVVTESVLTVAPVVKVVLMMKSGVTKGAKAAIETVKSAGNFISKTLNSDISSNFSNLETSSNSI